MGAGILLIVSFFLGFMVPEPKMILSDGKIAHWTEAVAVRETLLPAVVVSLLAFGQGGTLTFLPIHALKLGIENPGLWFGLYALCLLITRPIAGPLSDRISRRAIILPGLLLHLVSFLLLALASSPVWLWAAAVVGGFGVGAAQPALMAVAVDETSPQRRGQSLAQYQCFYDLGIGVGSMVLGALLDMVDQNFSIMYFTTVGVSFLALCLYHRRG